MTAFSVIIEHGPFGRELEALSKQESCSSLVSRQTAKTENSATTSFALEPLDHLEPEKRERRVEFCLDEYNDIKEEIFEYPSLREDDAINLFWSQEDVERRRRERNSMIYENCEERALFIACVEELFDVPLRKRVSKQRVESGDGSFVEYVAPVSVEEAIVGVSTSSYRGFENRCVRSIVSLRRRIIRQVLTAHWVRGAQQIHDIAAQVSIRQARFAHLVALGDAKVVAEYLGQEKPFC